MESVAVRPRLDLSYDVIQSRAPQYVGTRRDRADAIALAEWAAKRIGPATLTVFGPDGATIEVQRTVDGTGAAPSSAH